MARRAKTRPMPGPIPKPCPDMPVPMVSPGSAATVSTTGTMSGIVSIIPAQADFSFIGPRSGNIAEKSRSRRRILAILGVGLRMRIASKGDGVSACQRRLVFQASGKPLGAKG